jgi:hypothetical protein
VKLYQLDLHVEPGRARIVKRKAITNASVVLGSVGLQTLLGVLAYCSVGIFPTLPYCTGRVKTAHATLVYGHETVTSVVVSFHVTLFIDPVYRKRCAGQRSVNPSVLHTEHPSPIFSFLSSEWLSHRSTTSVGSIIFWSI